MTGKCGERGAKSSHLVLSVPRRPMLVAVAGSHKWAGRPGPLVLPRARASSPGMSLRSEIAEQPAAAARLLKEGAADAERIGAMLSRAKHLTVAARGSSDNAATYGKYLFEGLARIVTASAAPSLVTRYGTPPRYAGGAVIGISQSGAAPDVSAVIAAARRDGALTIAITNRASSALGRAAEHVFEL